MGQSSLKPVATLQISSNHLPETSSHFRQENELAIKFGNLS